MEQIALLGASWFVIVTKYDYTTALHVAGTEEIEMQTEL
jgi:hypothetical protein